MTLSSPPIPLREETAPHQTPQWDLKPLYQSLEDPKLAADLDEAKSASTDFRSCYEGHLFEMPAEAIAQALSEYSLLREKIGRALGYSDLLFASHMDDATVAGFHQTLVEQANATLSQLVFLPLELDYIDDQAWNRLIESPVIKTWRPWLHATREGKPHRLKADIESLLQEKTVSSRLSWIRLFDETTDSLRFQIDGQPHGISSALDRLCHREGDIRREAGQALASGLAERIRVFSLILNTIAKDKAIDDDQRGYQHPISERNHANRIEDSVVENLHQAVRAAHSRLTHRYYALKARRLKKDRLAFWDRNAPQPEDSERHFSFTEARNLVLDAYEAFDPHMAAIAEAFFSEKRIDAAQRSGKAPGAFCHPLVPSAQPYILLNYDGRARDVMTLAHELGHGIHQTLAAPLGILKSETPLTLAETASVFGEMLTFRTLMAHARRADEKRMLLADKIEDLLNTVSRQIAMSDFEQSFHSARQQGELTPDAIGQLWLQTQAKVLGPSFDLDPSYAVFWACVPHFVHMPFYVYAYAFGACVASSLHAHFETLEKGSEQAAFIQRYHTMLAAGGSLRHHEWLAPFAINTRNPAFWHDSLGLIENLIHELDSLIP